MLGTQRTLGRYYSAYAVLLMALLANLNVTAAEEAFPGRALYPGVPWVSLEHLHETRGVTFVVDARSAYEYETLHISNALNIPLGSKDFLEKVQGLRDKEPNRPIVFYCNGHTCMKSYKAALVAKKAKISGVHVYDAGIFAWANAYPEQTVMLGKSPIDKRALIGKDKLNQHLLDADAFGKWVQRDDSLLIDIRDRHQIEAVRFWPFKQETMPLDNVQLKHFINKAKQENKTLLVYDAVGKQVRWLQYFIESEGLTSYYFLKGGAQAYYETMLSEVSR